MTGLNEVTLMGWIRGIVRLDTWESTDGEKRAKARFLLAVPRRGKRDTKATYDIVPCVIWGRGAENLVLHCPKGSRIALRGRLNAGFWQPKDGSKERLSVSVMVETVTYLSKGESTENVAPQTKRRGLAA